MDLSDSARLSLLGSAPLDAEAVAASTTGVVVPVQRETLPTAAGVGPSAPPIHRGSMSAQPWRGFWRGIGDGLWHVLGRLGGAKRAPAEALEPWQRAAQRRRRTLLLLVALSAVGATQMLTEVLPVIENDALRFVQVSLFGLLFAWVAAGFFTAMMGFWVQLRGDRFALSAQDVRRRGRSERCRCSSPATCARGRPCPCP